MLYLFWKVLACQPPIHVKIGDPTYGGQAIGKRTLNLIRYSRAPKEPHRQSKWADVSPLLKYISGAVAPRLKDPKGPHRRVYSKTKNAYHASAYLSYLFDMKKQFFVGKKHIISVILTMTLDNQGGTTSLVIWHILIHNLHCLFCGSHLLTLKNIHYGKIRKNHSIQTKIFPYTIEKT